MATEIAPPEPPLIDPPVRARARLSLRHMIAWGGAATIALAAVVVTSQSESGGKRLQLAISTLSDPGRVIADLNEPAHAIAAIPPVAAKAEAPAVAKIETSAETERLAAQVRELDADRARLTARIATLEHNLTDMTGSIKLQSEQLAAARSALTPPPVLSPPPSIATVLPPVVPLELPAAQAQTAAANAPPPATETKTQLVPIPLARVTAAAAPEPQPAKVEFGIDLGGAGTLEALRIHWVAVKANYGPLLNGLHPLASRHAKQPAGVAYRLVAGPLPNAGEAAKLCARFPVNRIGCRPAKFDGVQLAGQ